MDGRVEMSHYAYDDGDTVRVSHASLRIYQDASCVDPSDSFDPESCCDDRERMVIEELRRYLRPECAPDCLLDRLKQMFDQMDELEQGTPDRNIDK